MLRTRTFGDCSSFIVPGFLHFGVPVLDLEDMALHFARRGVLFRCNLDGGLVILMGERVSRAIIVVHYVAPRTHLCDRLAW